MSCKHVYMVVLLLVAINQRVSSCPILEAPENGAITCLLGDDNQPTDGDVCTYICDNGFKLKGSPIRRCNRTLSQHNHNELQWSGSEAVCKEISSCPTLEAPENGTITCLLGDDNQPTSGDVCAYICDDGFKLRGNPIRRCRRKHNIQQWGGSEAECTEISSCPALGAPENGKITCLLGDDNQPTDGDVCTYVCDDGFKLSGDPTRRCHSQPNKGQWSGSEAVCTEKNGEFYLGSVPDFGASVTLLLLTNEAVPVYYSVEAPVTGYRHKGNITRSGSLLRLPTSLTGISRSYPNAQNNAHKEGVYIKTSSKKVTIICESELSSPHDSTSTYLALPTENLGIEEYVYYAVSVRAYVRADASVVMVGTADNTTFTLTVPVDAYIKINNSAQWTSLTPGTVYSYQINRLQIIYIAAFTIDLTGTKIVANKPISMFSGHECAWINGIPCDNIMEQMLPTELWGKVYYIAPLSSRESYTIKILSEENSTSIQMNCSTVSARKSYSLSVGNHITETLTNEDFCVIYSTKKILVVQFSHGNSEDGQGDPMMTLVPPTTHYTNTISTSTMQHPNINGYRHYVNIIVIAEYFQPDEIIRTTGGMNRSLESCSWTPIMRNNVTEAYATQVNVLEGAIKIFHLNKAALMTAVMYGFTAREGYGHAGWLRSYIVPSCPALEAPRNGKITCLLSNDNHPTDGDVCTYTCDDGFKLKGNPIRRCLNQRNEQQWSGSEAVCKEIPSCPALKAPENGTITCLLGDDNLPTHGDICNYICDNDFTLSGDHVRICHSSLNNGLQWSGSEAVCRQNIRCDTLSTPSNGGMSCSSGREGVGYEGDTCGFTCNTGYELTGSDNRICQSNGSWSGDESVCREGTCRHLSNPNNGSVSCILRSHRTPRPGDFCNFTCDNGYKYGDCSTTRVCQYNGIWSGKDAICERAIKCPNLHAPKDGTIHCTYRAGVEPIPGDTCLFSCNSGYKMDGSTTSVCQNSQIWSYPVPQCNKEKYITGLKVVCGEKTECSKGYVKLYVNLNMGTRGEHIYLCYKRSTDDSPINDIKAIAGEDCCFNGPSGYNKIDKDLNSKAEGDYIYLFYTTEHNLLPPIREVNVVVGELHYPPIGWERIETDLNKRAGGEYIYIVYLR